VWARNGFARSDGKGSVAPATAAAASDQAAQLPPLACGAIALSGSTQMIGVYIPILKGTFYT
jgi:LacI family transcriptional regulator